jgi:hypothetical protein
VPDVVANFGAVIQIAKNKEEFVAACQVAAVHPDEEAVERGLALAEANSWDRIVMCLEEHIQAVLPKGVRSRANKQLPKGDLNGAV